jgi:hypothetical protein
MCARPLRFAIQSLTADEDRVVAEAESEGTLVNGEEYRNSCSCSGRDGLSRLFRHRQYLGKPQAHRLRRPCASRLQQRHPALGACHALPESAALRPGLRRGEPLGQAGRAAELSDRRRRRPWFGAGLRRLHSQFASAVRRRRVVVLRASSRRRRHAHQRADSLRLRRQGNQVRRTHLLSARRQFLSQSEGRADRQAALDLDPLSRAGRRRDRQHEGV